MQKEQNPENGATVYNLSFVNKASLRDYSSIELPLHLENEKENYLYEKFETATTFKTYNSADFNTFNNNVTSAISAGGSNPYCPDGYRTPNQREIAIMAYNKLWDGSEFYYHNGTSQGFMMCRTGFSFGALGLNTVPIKYGYSFANGIITLQTDATASTTRCVRDIRVDKTPPRRKFFCPIGARSHPQSSSATTMRGNNDLLVKFTGLFPNVG